MTSVTPAKPIHEDWSPNPISIVGSDYLFPDEVSFCYWRKIMHKKAYVLNASDKEKKIHWSIRMFEPKEVYSRNKFMVFDSNNKIVMTLKNAQQNFHARWKVYKGKGKDEKDLLFTVRKHRPLSKNDLDVFLPSTNEEGGECDFKVEANWWNDNFLIKQGDHTLARGISMNKLLRMSIEHTPTDLYNVTVSPQVDSAFIVALTTLYHEIKTGGAYSYLGAIDSDSD
ncbi:hypothetical protein ACHQM5_027011 [Ranunculus cassubicifolius]